MVQTRKNMTHSVRHHKLWPPPNSVLVTMRAHSLHRPGEIKSDSATSRFRNSAIPQLLPANSETFRAIQQLPDSETSQKLRRLIGEVGWVELHSLVG